MKSAQELAEDLFVSVRGRQPSRSEADRWVVAQMAQTIARIKREAFRAGATRYRNRLLTLASPAEAMRLSRVPLREPAVE